MKRAWPYLLLIGIVVAGVALAVVLGWTDEEGFGGAMGFASLAAFGLLVAGDWITRSRRARRQVQTGR